MATGPAATPKARPLSASARSLPRRSECLPAGRFPDSLADRPQLDVPAVSPPILHERICDLASIATGRTKFGMYPCFLSIRHRQVSPTKSPGTALPILNSIRQPKLLWTLQGSGDTFFAMSKGETCGREEIGCTARDIGSHGTEDAPRHGAFAWLRNCSAYRAAE